MIFTFSRQITPGGDRSKEMYAAIDTLFEPVREHCRELRNFLREVDFPKIMPKTELVVVELNGLIGATARDINAAMKNLTASMQEINAAYVAERIQELTSNKDKLAIIDFTYKQTDEEKARLQELYTKQIKLEAFNSEEEQYILAKIETTFKAMITTITELQVKLSGAFDAVLSKMTDLKFKFPSN